VRDSHDEFEESIRMRIVNDSEHCRRWWVGSRAGDAVQRALDANADGAITLGDFVTWAVYIFHLPAYTGMIIVDSFPLVAQFFAVDCRTGFGWGGTLFSLVAWALLATSVATPSKATDARIRNQP
jgi:hypothetical protein